jgi:hypothetical protein
MSEEKKQVRIAIDACRPRSDDAEQLLPDNRHRDALRRSERFDLAVAAMLSQGDVPQDLEARLLELVSDAPAAGEPGQTALPWSDPVMAAVTEQGLSSRSEVASDSDAPVTLADDTSIVPGSESRRRFSRRLVAATISLSMVVLVTLAVIWHNSGVDDPANPASELADRAARWLPRLEKQLSNTDAWSTSMAQLPEGYEADRSIIPAVRKWQAFSTELDSQSVLLDLSSKRYGRVYLVVIKTARRYSLPAHRPLRKLTSSGQWSLAAWQQGEMLFVLVGGSDVRSLDALLQSPLFG